MKSPLNRQKRDSIRQMKTANVNSENSHEVTLASFSVSLGKTNFCFLCSVMKAVSLLCQKKVVTICLNLGPGGFRLPCHSESTVPSIPLPSSNSTGYGAGARPARKMKKQYGGERCIVGDDKLSWKLSMSWGCPGSRKGPEVTGHCGGACWNPSPVDQTSTETPQEMMFCRRAGPTSAQASRRAGEKLGLAQTSGVGYPSGFGCSKSSNLLLKQRTL